MTGRCAVKTEERKNQALTGGVFTIRASPWPSAASAIVLREPTQAQQQQLRAEHEAAAALCLKVGLRSCKELREARDVDWVEKGLAAANLATLGSLGAVLPALEVL